MIGSYFKNHFHQCVAWGIILQCFGGLVPLGWDRLMLAVLGLLTVLCGTLLMVVGFAYYAKTKGRSPTWSLLALASIFGWIVLILLKPKHACVLTGDSPQRGT